jgi:hypothetical protein
MKDLNQDSQWPGWNANLAPSEYKSSTLPPKIHREGFYINLEHTTGFYDLHNKLSCSIQYGELPDQLSNYCYILGTQNQEVCQAQRDSKTVHIISLRETSLWLNYGAWGFFLSAYWMYFSPVPHMADSQWKTLLLILTRTEWLGKLSGKYKHAWGGSINSSWEILKETFPLLKLMLWKYIPTNDLEPHFGTNNLSTAYEAQPLHIL